MSRIEEMIDDEGVTSVLEEVIRLCYAKSILGNSDRWLKVAMHLDDAARRIDADS